MVVNQEGGPGHAIRTILSQKEEEKNKTIRIGGGGKKGKKNN